MSEQTPKTPRQLGEEAQSLYAEHNKKADYLAMKESDRDYIEERIVHHGKGDGYGEQSENFHFFATRLAKNILEQRNAKRDIDEHTATAKEHVEQNVALYHDSAVLEAAFDGVEIKVTDQTPDAQPVEVHKA